MAQRIITAVDLFCGGGGTSTGLQFACDELDYRLNLSAINHSEVAIQTHSANHPGARHMCESLDSVDPRKVYPNGKIDLLVASPECTNHSRAKGGKPKQDQSRATAWQVVRWCDALQIKSVLMENVREFLDWGPLDSKGFPIKSRRGETFQAFLQALRSLGYKVDHRILNAADYGAATSRERLFIQAHRGRKQIVWPTPSHAEDGQNTLFGSVDKWRGAREIIDWSLKGKSIFTRKKPLCANTLRRISIGLSRFGNSEPFLVILKKASTVKNIDSPIPSITTIPYIYLAQPFLVKYYGTGTVKSLDEPLDTITSRDRFGLVMPERNGKRLDIGYRMLKPHELAAAMSFPSDYYFAGKQKDKVEQIGNAVDVNQSKALCLAILGGV